jgi:hypothetical protein
MTLRTFLRLLPITICGLLLNIAIVGSFNGGLDIFITLTLGFFGFCFLIAFLTTIIKDRNLYKQSRLKISFIPTFVGILFIVSFFITNLVVAARDKSPVLIKAIFVEDFYGSGFEFREDGTYKFTEISGLMDVTYTRGKYILKDSLITLDRKNLHDIVQSDLLVIRNEKNDSASTPTIYQINKQHGIIKESTEYEITIDKRK